MMVQTKSATLIPDIKARLSLIPGVEALNLLAEDVITVTIRAIMMEPDIWRKVVFTAVPCAKSRFSRLLIPQVVSGMVIIEVPIMRIA